ncbi:general stress protein [Candidatus Saccharibacteria bacterium]|nr:general stress protein [Candidatus Saccharibacteria bacterium]
MADTSNRGFASMDDDKQREIASKGGKASGGNFANDPQKASEAGRKGAQNQPTEAKRRGGENSRGGGRS